MVRESLREMKTRIKKTTTKVKKEVETKSKKIHYCFRLSHPDGWRLSWLL